MSGDTHKHRYKIVGVDSQELRRRREEEGVQIRKLKREQQLSKRRNVAASMEDDPDLPNLVHIFKQYKPSSYMQ